MHSEGNIWEQNDEKEKTCKLQTVSINSGCESAQLGFLVSVSMGTIVTSNWNTQPQMWLDRRSLGAIGIPRHRCAIADLRFRKEVWASLHGIFKKVEMLSLQGSKLPKLSRLVGDKGVILF